MVIPSGQAVMTNNDRMVTWTLVRGKRKGSGLSTRIIARMNRMWKP
jgi:hypothetical protein